MPETALGLWLMVLSSALIAYVCAALRGWGPQSRWLAILVGLHLTGPIGWTLILIVPRRRN